MKAWKISEFGEPTEVVRLDENAASPSAQKGQLVVTVEAAGIGLPDVFMCRDNYPLTPPLPFVPSQEACGRVSAVGEGVDPGLVGARVFGMTLFQQGAGGMAEECLMDAAAAYPVPEGMRPEDAAGFFIPFQTAWVGLVHRARITADDTVLVLGASGSSGAAAVQLAKAKGARVIAVAGGPAKKAFCEKLGPDVVIDHHSEDITESAMVATDGKGVSVVFDPVGGKPARAAFKATAFEGRFIVIGYASGEWPRIHLSETVMMNISLVGAMPFGFPRSFFESSLEDLAEHWRAGQLESVSVQIFDFDEGREAIAHIADGKVEGKVVVRCGLAAG